MRVDVITKDKSKYLFDGIEELDIHNNSIFIRGPRIKAFKTEDVTILIVDGKEIINTLFLHRQNIHLMEEE